MLTDYRLPTTNYFLCFFDHLPLPIAERLVRIALQHAQIAADDRRRRAEFMDRERQQLWILFSG